ncbi:hypothetical protein HDU98_002424 [Podochytrium sp. JEL0797]|nr:hypothetical protein HDU98_002424 [Podochytrium sp. JEL0797]
MTIQRCHDADLDVAFITGPLLGRGFNCEHFRSVILSSHPQSPRELVQWLGRVCRKGQLGAACIVFNPSSPSNAQHRLEDVFFDNDGDEEQMRKWERVRRLIADIKQMGLEEGLCLRKGLYWILYEKERDACSGEAGEVLCGFCRDEEAARKEEEAKVAVRGRRKGVANKPRYAKQCVLPQLNQMFDMLRVLGEVSIALSIEGFWEVVVKREALDAAKKTCSRTITFSELLAFDKDYWLESDAKEVRALNAYATA